MKDRFGQFLRSRGDVLAGSSADHPIGDFSTHIVVKERQRINGCSGVGQAPDPVVAQVPGAVFEIIRKSMARKFVICCRRVVAPQFGIVTIGTEDCDLILHLDHEYRVCLRVHLLQVLHEGAEPGDFALDHGLVIIRDSIVVRDAVGVHGAWVSLLVGNDVHRSIKLAAEVAIDRARAAGAVSEPVQDQFQVILFRESLGVIGVRASHRK
jgi:hypothetical protein